MGDLSMHFSRSEFACRCGCGFQTVDFELLQVLEWLRLHFQQPVIINSGARCRRHNRYIGGSPGSKHQQGIAADIKIQFIDSKHIVEYLDQEYPDKYGIGLYPGWVHIDVRPNKSRWNG